jgi:two-component system, LytTR family, response regulator
MKPAIITTRAALAGNGRRTGGLHSSRNPERDERYLRNHTSPHLTPGLTLTTRDRTWKSLKKTPALKPGFVFLTFYEMQTLLRTLIVDSEAPARELLQDMLATHRNVRVVGEANSAPTAVSLYEDLHPNLVFMDVQMPKGDGFSLLPKLQPLPAIIFVTACDQFAVRAFEVDAVDYLLKPVRPERLANALQRVVHSQKPAEAERLSCDDKILLDSETEMRVVFVAEISGIVAEANYTRVHLADGSFSLVRRGISHWDCLLPKPFFVRVDRSLIIHLGAVRKVVAESSDEVFVDVEGFGAPLTLGRRGSFRLRRALRESSALPRMQI